MRNSIKLSYIIGFLIIIYTVGILGLSWENSREFFTPMTPLIIIMSSMLLIIYHKQGKPIHLLIFSIVFTGGFFFEALGVNTGLIFGDYSYSDVLGWKLFDTPLLIGLNWAILIYMIWNLMAKWKLYGWIKIFIGSAMMVAYDIVLEPFAITYGLWKWEAVSPPIRNYIAWFVISMLFFVIVRVSGITFKNKLAPYLLLIQFLFFCILVMINIY
jgi:bisanhydrobacterioruberin hydratase